MKMYTTSRIKELLGKTLVSVTGAEHGSETITFETSDGEVYMMRHDQDCCEEVEIEDICGEVNDILNSPITMASEESNKENPVDVPAKKYQESFTWTFYKIGTAKGSITIRWYGSSNGYYSEEVEFCLVEEKYTLEGNTVIRHKLPRVEYEFALNDKGVWYVKNTRLIEDRFFKVYPLHKEMYEQRATEFFLENYKQ